MVSLDIKQETSIAVVTVATGITRIEILPQGQGRINTVASKRHAVVPEWWAVHLQNEERSTIQTSLVADADVGITTLPLDLDSSESTVEPPLLADPNDDSRRTITGTAEGPLFVVHTMRAEWEDPTTAEGVIRITADVENVRPIPLTISEIDARIEINGVFLTNTRLPEQYTFDARERKTIVFRIPVDSSRMEAWWPTHVRNGERSALDRQVTATIGSDRGGERVPLEFLSETVTVETDLLAGD